MKELETFKNNAHIMDGIYVRYEKDCTNGGSNSWLCGPFKTMADVDRHLEGYGEDLCTANHYKGYQIVLVTPFPLG